MKLKIIVIAGGLGLASLGAIGAYALSGDVRQGLKAGEAAIALASHRHGWGRRGGGPVRMLCSEARSDRIEAAIAFAETFMAFTPEQRAAWDRLAAAVRAGSDKVGETCAETEALQAEKTLPAKLALAEAASRTAAAVLGDVRPAFDAWYAALDDDQRKALDGLLQHRGRKPRG